MRLFPTNLLKSLESCQGEISAVEPEVVHVYHRINRSYEDRHYFLRLWDLRH